MISRSCVFGSAVAAIGVGMMALHQDLEFGLDIGPLGIGFKAEHIQRPALGIENLALFRRPAAAAGAAAAGSAE